MATEEVVINIVNFDIVQQMSLSSSEYAEGENEIEKADPTTLKSKTSIVKSQKNQKF